VVSLSYSKRLLLALWAAVLCQRPLYLAALSFRSIIVSFPDSRNLDNSCQFLLGIEKPIDDLPNRPPVRPATDNSTLAMRDATFASLRLDGQIGRAAILLGKMTVL